MTPAPPFTPPWWWRAAGSLTRPLARALLPDRCGPWPVASAPTTWLHAASLGETKGLLRLAASLDGAPLTLTATTASGLARLRRERPDLASFLLPWDDATTVDAFLASRRVERAVFLEAEAWPTAFSRLAIRGAPLAMAAVRCGPRSRARWRRLSRLVPGMTESVSIAWADGDPDDPRGCGFSDVRPGASLKWAGIPPATPSIAPGRLAAISFHVRDLLAIARLARAHRGASWLWFPRRIALVPVCRLLARILHLRPIADSASPAPGEVWIAPRLGLVPSRLPGCEAAWVSPGHDLEEPSRLGVPHLLRGASAPSRTGRSPEETLGEVVAWLRKGAKCSETAEKEPAE